MGTIEQNVVLRIKALSELKQLVNARNELMALKKAGVTVTKPMTTINKRFKQMHVSARSATRAFTRFKMEMLSVMFFGMAMASMFGNLLKPAAQLVGLFDIWGATLQVLFLPVMLRILDLLLPFMEWIMGLPDPVKNAIGGFAIFGFILGKLLFTIGTMALGLAGLMKVFGGSAIIGNIFSAIGGIFTATGAVIAAVVAVIILIIVGMRMAWNENFLGMKETWAKVVEGLKTMFSGFVNFFKGIWMVLKGLFTGDGKMMVEGLKKMFTGLWNFLKGGAEFLMNINKAILIGIAKIFVNVFMALKDAVIVIWDWIVDKLGWIWDKIKGIGSAVKDFFTGGGDKSGNSKSSRQTGGYIPHDGLYKLHAGENVSQSNNSFSPNITVNAGSNVDIEVLKKQLSTQWNEELTGMSR